MNAEVERLKEENTDLKVEIQSAGNREKELADLERLNSLLRLKVEEAAKWETSNAELIRKIDHMDSNLQR